MARPKATPIAVAAALVAAPAHGSAQTGRFGGVPVPPVLTGSLQGANVREALHGSISPDGRLLAYEVVLGQDRSIWFRNLSTGEPRALTTRGHENYGAVWSPDGSKIAFAADSMIAVADVSTGAQHIVFDGALTKYRRPIVKFVQWSSDSELSIGYFEPALDRIRQSRWAVRIDSTGAHELSGSSWADSIGGITSPNEKWVARWVPTTAGRGSLWLSATQDRHSRCLVGLFTEDSRPYWSRGSDALLFVGHTGADTTPRVYELALAGGAAKRVSAVTGSASSLSVNGRGDVAIITRASGTVVAGDLWLGRYPLAVNERDTLAHCHDLPADVVRWVKRQGLPDVHGVAELTAEPDEQVSLFHATYGLEGDPGIFSNLVGLRYRGRIGWLIPPPGPDADRATRRLQRFELKPGDTYLLSAQWDSALANVSSQATGWWRNILLFSPATPLSELTGIVAQDPSLAAAAAQNPALISPVASESQLLALAAVSPILAARVMDNPRVAHDLPAWRWIEGRYANRRDAVTLFQQHWLAAEPELYSDSLVPEPVLLELLLSRYSVSSRGDSLLFRLVANPAALHSLRIVTILATDRENVPEGVRQRALATLERRGITRAQAVRTVIRAEGRDSVPCDEVAQLLGDQGLGDEGMETRVEYVTTQSQRCSDLRRQIGRGLADNPYTPPPVLRTLAAWVADSRDEAIAAALITNETVRDDSEALRLVAGLSLRRIAQQADSLLRAPDHWGRDRGATVTWDTTAWARADSGTSILLVPASYTSTGASVPDDPAALDTVRLIIRDQSAWISFWNRLQPREGAAQPDTVSPPEVDLRTYEILAASNGQPRWGGIVDFNGARLLHDTVYVKVLTRIGRPASCASAGAQRPVAISLMARPKAPIVFLEGRWIRSCSPWARP